MMRLQVVEVQEGTEESARGKTETASKMSKEDDSLTGSCLGHYLVAGDAPLDLGRHLAGSDEGLDGDGRSFGPLPARAGGLGEIRSGRLHWSLKQEQIEEKEMAVSCRKQEILCRGGSGAGERTSRARLVRAEQGVRARESS